MALKRDASATFVLLLFVPSFFPVVTYSKNNRTDFNARFILVSCVELL